MACVFAKLCLTSSQKEFDFDFDPNRNFVPQCQLDIFFLCLYKCSLLA